MMSQLGEIAHWTTQLVQTREYLYSSPLSMSGEMLMFKSYIQMVPLL